MVGLAPSPDEIRARIAAATGFDTPQAAGLQELGEAVQRRAENWSDPVRAGLSYYRIPDRRMPRGRLTLLQNGMNAMEMVEHRGYVSLRSKYGGFKSANQIGDWQRNDPYLGLVQRNGLHEFDARQLHDLKWHHTPTADAQASHLLVWQQIQARIDAGAEREAAILAVLPQLEGWDLDEYPCKLCPQRVGGAFTTPDGLEAHRSIAHKENVQTEGTRDAVAAALQASGGDMTKLIAALTSVAQAMAAAQPQAQAEAPRPKGARGATDDA